MMITNEGSRVRERSLFGLELPPACSGWHSASPYSLTYTSERKRGEEGSKFVFFKYLSISRLFLVYYFPETYFSSFFRFVLFLRQSTDLNKFSRDMRIVFQREAAHPMALAGLGLEDLSRWLPLLRPSTGQFGLGSQRQCTGRRTLTALSQSHISPFAELFFLKLDLKVFEF